MQPDHGKQIFLHHFPVSRETIEKLEHYEHLLQLRGATLSLVGRSTFNTIWQRHFLDSAQLLPYANPDIPLVDMGSGAGFPGMVLSIMGLKHVHLVENNQKKVSFLREVAQAVSASVTIHNIKAEALPAMAQTMITARALAPLDTLLRLSQSFSSSKASALFLKGKNASLEIIEARKNWNFSLEIFPSLTSAKSSILRLTQIRRK